MSDIKWGIKTVNVSTLKEWPKNPRKITKERLEKLVESISKFGSAEPPVINTDYVICGGHGRKKAYEKLGMKEVDCYMPSRGLTEKEFEELNIRLNKNIAGEWDFDVLANEFEVEELVDWGFSEDDFGLNKIDEIDLTDKKKELSTDNLSNDIQHTCPQCGLKFND